MLKLENIQKFFGGRETLTGFLRAGNETSYFKDTTKYNYIPIKNNNLKIAQTFCGLSIIEPELCNRICKKGNKRITSLSIDLPWLSWSWDDNLPALPSGRLDYY